MNKTFARTTPLLAGALLAGVAGAANPAFAVGGPDNDLFNRAENLTSQGCDATTEGDNFGAGGQPGEPAHGGPGSLPTQSAWTKWRSPVSDTVIVDTAGSDFDTILAVYHGTRAQHLQVDGANDDSGGTLQSEVSFEAQRNVTYRIAVDSFGAAEGNYVLNLRC
jgi:hypothetical protein